MPKTLEIWPKALLFNAKLQADPIAQASIDPNFLKQRDPMPREFEVLMAFMKC